jgi:hypothetical protein
MSNSSGDAQQQTKWAFFATLICYYGIMAVRKLTVSIPAELAEELRRRVPARDRSKYVTRALQESFRRSEDALVRACRLANEDPDARAIEEEFDTLKDQIVEPWDDSSAR